MKNPVKILSAITILALLCSCSQQNEPETTSVAEPSQVTEKTEIISETDITESHETNAVQNSDTATVTQTEAVSEPVYDKDTAPVMHVSNIDHCTNYMSWTEIEGAQSYMLYLLNEETGEFEEYGRIEGTDCNDIDLRPNTKYTYKASAEFPDGERGAMSEQTEIYTYNYIGRHTENCSLFAEQGEWVYFAGENGHPCKMRHDGTDLSEITGDNASQINVVGENIYYLWTDIDYNDYICRIKTDGTDKTVLFDAEHYRAMSGAAFSPNIYDMTVIDGRIYFVMSEVYRHDSLPSYKVMLMETDGRSMECSSVYNGGVCFPEILGFYNDTLYIGYNDRDYTLDGYDSGYGMIYKDEYLIQGINETAELTAAIPASKCSPLYFDGETFIYKESGSNDVYSYKLSAGEAEYIGKEINSYGGVVRGDTVYYSDKDSGALMKMSISSGKIQKLADGLDTAAWLGDRIWLMDKDNKIYTLDGGEKIAALN